MLFNSLSFLVFFPITTLLYFLLPHKYRWILLLIASGIFYMAFIPAYILFLLALILIDYFLAIQIEKANGKNRKIFLLVSIFSTCLTLFVFKYFNFFAVNFNLLANFLHWNYSMDLLKLILPIGLSFHTFQSLSYVFEVYKKNQKTERNLGIYALYVLFYPQLVAGPIERPYNLLPQFHEEHFFDYRRVVNGLKLMAWGMFKKVVIADRLAVFVNHVFDNVGDYRGISFIIAIFFFAYQIYCDFSGYSDIAIGSAQVMGFNLMKNFNQPYFSKSVTEFWRKWHISLSSWFRDYIYIPLGGSRVSVPRHYFNLFITFLLSGLWHGAGWTFVIWGSLNGLYIILEKMTINWREKIINIIHLDKASLIYKFSQVFFTFSLISFSWIFFRAKNAQDSFYIIGHLFSGLGDFLHGLLINPMATLIENHNLFLMDQGKYDFFLAILGIIILEIIQLMQKKGSIREAVASKPWIFRWGLYVGLILVILNFGQISKAFIYFQF
jgi:alginate O-acetyltransferase complex protein AlgI